MSSEIVKKALDLETHSQQEVPTVAKKCKATGNKNKSATKLVQNKTAKPKSIVEMYKEKSTVDYLKQNLTYIMHERKKSNLQNVAKLIESYQTKKHLDSQYWKEKQRAKQLKRRKKLPYVFTDEDFARIVKKNKSPANKNLSNDSIL